MPTIFFIDLELYAYAFPLYVVLLSDNTIFWYYLWSPQIKLLCINIMWPQASCPGWSRTAYRRHRVYAPLRLQCLLSFEVGVSVLFTGAIAISVSIPSAVKSVATSNPLVSVHINKRRLSESVQNNYTAHNLISCIATKQSLQSVCGAWYCQMKQFMISLSLFLRQLKLIGLIGTESSLTLSVLYSSNALPWPKNSLSSQRWLRIPPTHVFSSASRSLDPFCLLLHLWPLIWKQSANLELSMAALTVSKCCTIGQKSAADMLVGDLQRSVDTCTALSEQRNILACNSSEGKRWGFWYWWITV